LTETITSIEFKHYKGLGNFSLRLTRKSILVGPNNCGKSTIIGAFRVLAEGMRVARAKSPERIVLGESVVVGYRIPKDSIAISTENVHTNYKDIDSSVTFRISNGNQLRVVFPEKGGCLLIPDSARSRILSPKSFNAAFPITVSVVPVLGPLEQDEPRVEPATVQRNLHTTRASRHFRNYWLYRPEEFAKFHDLVEQTWPGMNIEAPVDDGDVIHMFCQEERIPRELFWSGFGFQVWCQLLTHLVRGQDASIIVVDEPEIYLHPDLQRQLLDILFSLGPVIVMATHSAEMIGAADAGDIVLVDKKSRSGKRLANDELVQGVLDAIGSIHNVTLTRIARHRRVLFVEGKDYPLLLKFAGIAGYMDLSAGASLPSVSSDGFNNWTKVRDTAWGIKKILGGPFRMASMLDRDFRSDEEIESIRRDLEAEIELAIFLSRKEIENYLLVPTAICGAINADARRRGGSKPTDVCTTAEVEEELMKITDPLTSEIRAQYSASRSEYLNGVGDKRATATLIQEAGDWFDQEWRTLEGRIRIGPGKQVLAKIREWAQGKHGVSVTTSLITSKMSASDVAPDLVDVLDKIDQFRVEPLTEVD
jgi:AAA domain, putative AbiEii toxin, Type IV TA system/AAA ATPase domain